MTTRGDVSNEPISRERAFWDAAVPDLAASLELFERGPDQNTAAMLDALEPLEGATVLDFACGGGVTSAWLCRRGAKVTGLDLSPESAAGSRRLCQELGYDADFQTGEIFEAELPRASFDRIFGRYALHHVDVPSVGPLLAQLLKPGGVAVFLETMDLNPVLRFSRNNLVGRFGVKQFGTEDEHPLTKADLEILRASFGTLRTEVPRMEFFRILDRQVFGYRSRIATAVTGALDDALHRLGLRHLSYHQLLRLTNTAED